MLRALVVSMLVALAFVAPTPVQADGGCGAGMEAVPLPGGLGYTCVEITPGGGGGEGDPGGGGQHQPTCTLVPPGTWCNGTTPCYTEDWHPPYVLPEGDPPKPDTPALVDLCLQSGGYYIAVRIYWASEGEPPPPSLQDQARTATGQLSLALPALSTSPTRRTLVNLPTWFWIEGGDPEQVGSSAFGLRAIATVSSLDIATGDGTTITCPWTTSSTEAETSCDYTYRRASNDGTATQDGRPADTVSATSTWDIRFELNGVNVTIPGAPTTLQGPASTAVLRVAESQSVVTDTR